MRTKKISDIRIGNKKVGYLRDPFIVAEAGVNHNGSLSTALKLVDAAAWTGADAIKFQTFKANQVVTPNVPMVEYQKKNMGKATNLLTLIKALELKDEFYFHIIKKCKERGIIFFSAPHGGFDSIDLLEKLKIPAFKFASGDLTNLPALEYSAKYGRPMILGTGMATINEIKEAVSCIRKSGNNKILVLHCTTQYPCKPDQVNLRAMKKMMEKLDVLVGYSDHTMGIQVPIIAATLGACMIEKHLTLDKKMKGPDHKASLEPKEFKKMVDEVRLVKTILGSEEKKPTKSELSYIPIIRKSLVANAYIRKGERFSRKNISIKRPGTGLNPKFYSQIIGKKAKMDIKADTLIQKKHYGQ